MLNAKNSSGSVNQNVTAFLYEMCSEQSEKSQMSGNSNNSEI